MKDALVLIVMIVAMMGTLCYAIYNMTKVTEDVIEDKEN